MKKPRICGTIVDQDLEAIKEIEPLIDLFEVRLDLIGSGWTDVVKFIKKPWIACNRSLNEGGKADPNEVKRIEELIWAAEAGACMVDIEYHTKNLTDIIPLIKSRTKCLVSFHDIVGTPAFDTLVNIMESQIKSGADICKVVTTAQDHKDNLTVLKLIDRFPETKVIAMAMGEIGRLSRILCPLAGGYFTYASLAPGKESADGQLTVYELIELYRIIK